MCCCCVQEYFEVLGYTVPPHMNPSDAYMDIITGTILRPGQAQVHCL